MRPRRRRISPRAKRRYRAIKEFLQRLLGISPMPNIENNSSIPVNVSDLKHKIVDLEQELSVVNRRYRELISLKNDSLKESQTQLQHKDLSILKDQAEISSNKLLENETYVPNKNSESQRKSDDMHSVGKVHNDVKINYNRPEDVTDLQFDKVIRMEKQKSKSDSRFRYPKETPSYLRARSSYDNTTSFNAATTCLHLPQTGRSQRLDNPACLNKKLKQHDPVDSCNVKKPKHSKKYSSFADKYEKQCQRRTTKESNVVLAENINRQHGPINNYCETDMSLFSTPARRVKECPARKNIRKCSDLCLYCFNCHRKSSSEDENELSDLRSVKTRLYSGKRPTPRHRYHRIQGDNYNDSSQYDLIPVKEKASPKSGKYTYPYGLKEPPHTYSNRPQYCTDLADYKLQKILKNQATQLMVGSCNTVCSDPPNQIKAIQTHPNYRQSSRMEIIPTLGYYHSYRPDPLYKRLQQVPLCRKLTVKNVGTQSNL